ncbi:MAG: DUF5615 family PIN-like protein [Bacteroidia bacterium]
MAKFLIDANLPIKIDAWNNDEFIHISTINDSFSDEEIWNYALMNNLIIITKDADFSIRILLKNPPPYIIHFRVGNLRLSELNNFINKVWKDIEPMTNQFKLINVYLDRIEAIR